jgi:DNA-directed RNA polymerase alpha subunit
MIKIKSIRINKISTKSDLELMTCDELYSFARQRFGLREVLINFLDTQEYKNHLVRDIECSDRLKNILLRAEIDSLDELNLFRKVDVTKFNGMGVKSLRELEKVMAEFNIEFRQLIYYTK